MSVAVPSHLLPFSGSFNFKVNACNRWQEKLIFQGLQSLKISCAFADTLETDADYTEIKNSKIKNIHTKGDLYLHDCDESIESISSDKNIYLFKAEKIGRVTAKGKIRVFEEKDMFSMNTVFSASETNICYIREDVEKIFTFQIRGRLVSDDYMTFGSTYKIVEIWTDCTTLLGIIFEGDKYSTDERQVIVKAGAIFNGTVVGGQLVRL